MTARPPDTLDIDPSLLALVRSEAHRIARLLPDGAIDLDDLAGHGHLGLVEASRRYDPTRGVNFELYARHRIRGAIFDGLRQTLGPLRLRTYRRLQSQIIAWRLAGDPPPPAPARATHPAAAAASTYTAIADLATALLAARAETQPEPPDPETEFVHREALARITTALAHLDDDERAVLRAIYDLDDTGDTGAALARRWNMHRSGVTRRHLATLDKLRRWLGERPP
jgi:RNA polymerase sigma factor (sigma-70 family)